jgi:hypothetical protein
LANARKISEDKAHEAPGDKLLTDRSGKEWKEQGEVQSTSRKSKAPHSSQARAEPGSHLAAALLLAATLLLAAALLLATALPTATATAATTTGATRTTGATATGAAATRAAATRATAGGGANADHRGAAGTAASTAATTATTVATTTAATAATTAATAATTAATTTTTTATATHGVRRDDSGEVREKIQERRGSVRLLSSRALKYPFRANTQPAASCCFFQLPGRRHETLSAFPPGSLGPHAIANFGVDFIRSCF